MVEAMAESQASATQALKKLEDQLTCAICLDTYKEPKLLHCFHVYCKTCLQRLVVQTTDREGGAAPLGQGLCIRCPTCRKPTFLLSSNGVSDLQPAQHICHLFELRATLVKAKTPENIQCQKCTKTFRKAISFCRDCAQFVCELCVDIHEQWKEFAKHEVVSIDDLVSTEAALLPVKNKVLYCPQHKGKELDIYCDTCEELICHHCTIKKHKDHQYDLISDTFDQHKAEIEASLKPIEDRVAHLGKVLERLDERSERLDTQRDAGEAFIHDQIDQLHRLLDERRKELFKRVDKEVKAKLASLAARKEEMESVQSQLDSCLTVVTASLETGSEEEILKAKNHFLEQINEVSSNAKAAHSKSLPTSDLSDVQMIVSQELEEARRQFTEINLVEMTPDMVYGEGRGIKVAELGKNTDAILRIRIAINGEGTTFAVPLDIMTCDIVSEASGQVTRCALKRTGIDHFTVSYTPTQRGRHQLHIKIDDVHIDGSPFGITVKLPAQDLGTPVKTITAVKRPWGVATNSRGDVIVADFSGHQISVFNSTSGERLHSFRSCGGEGHDEIFCPRGVAVDSDDNILVVDGNHCIKKFTSQGEFVASVGQEGSDRMEFKRPTGVGVHPHTAKVYVTDAQNHRIQILNSDLSFCGTFNGGSGEGCLAYPWSVALDSSGHVYVADSDNHFIQVYTVEGEYLRRFGGEGERDGELNFPTSIWIDIDDVAYVTEYGNHRVSMFTCDGHFLSSFGAAGTDPGQFNEPRGVTVSREGYVIVTDCENSCIQLF